MFRPAMRVFSTRFDAFGMLSRGFQPAAGTGPAPLMVPCDYMSNMLTRMNRREVSSNTMESRSGPRCGWSQRVLARSVYLAVDFQSAAVAGPAPLIVPRD